MYDLETLMNMTDAALESLSMGVSKEVNRLCQSDAPDQRKEAAGQLEDFAHALNLWAQTMKAARNMLLDNDEGICHTTDIDLEESVLKDLANINSPGYRPV